MADVIDDSKLSADIDAEMNTMIDFGHMFSNAVGTLGNNVAKLKHAYKNTNELTLSLKKLMEEQKFELIKSNDDVKRLKRDLNDVREKLQVDRDVGEALQTTFEHKTLKAARKISELEKERDRAKYEIRNNNEKRSLNVIDTVAKFNSSMAKFDHGPIPLNNLDKYTQLALGNMVQRLLQVEQAFLLQEDVNNTVANSMKNDNSVEKLNSIFNEQVQFLEISLAQANEENVRLNGALDNLTQQHTETARKLTEMILKDEARYGKRKMRGKMDVDAYAIAPMDHYTLEESDFLSERVRVLEEKFETEITQLNSAVRHMHMDIDDMRTDIDKNRRKFEEYVAQMEELRKKQEAELGNKGVKQVIKKVKPMWVQLQDRIAYSIGLLEDNSVISDVSVDVDATRNAVLVLNSIFVQKLSAFNDNIDEVILHLRDDGDINEIVNTLAPLLDSLTIECEDILAMNEKNKLLVAKSDFNEPTFVDLPGQDPNEIPLEQYLFQTYEASLPIIDEKVDKIRTRRRVESLEQSVRKKVDEVLVNKLEHDIRVILNGKAEEEKMLALITKKASLAEVFTIKDQLMKQIEISKPIIQQQITYNSNQSQYANASSFAESATTNMTALHTQMTAKAAQTSSSSGVLASIENTMPTPIAGPMSMPSGYGGQIYDEGLNKKFTMLFDQFKDLEKEVLRYVPREEVESAMKALLTEVKEIKVNSVNTQMLKDGLRLKADDREVKRLVEAVTFAVGSLEGQNKAAGVHKCLVCDKPITSVNTKNSTKLSNDSSELDKQDKGIYARLGSPDTSSRAKVAIDLAILRNIIDLPPINDPRDGPLFLGSADDNNAGGNNKQYKQRIRAAGGGGFKG